jgi:hypothetical protein
VVGGKRELIGIFHTGGLGASPANGLRIGGRGGGGGARERLFGTYLYNNLHDGGWRRAVTVLCIGLCSGTGIAMRSGIPVSQCVHYYRYLHCDTGIAMRTLLPVSQCVHYYQIRCILPDGVYYSIACVHY